MFVALDLPDDARSALAAWRDELVAGRSDLRPVDAGALHVTLVFLGWQDESAAQSIAAAGLGAADVAAPLLLAREVRALPPRDPRLFALDLDDEERRAETLQRELSSALEAGGWYRPEKRPFWPHLTLARVKKRERRVPALPASPAPPSEPFLATRLTLYRSTLRPQGAVYDPLAGASLR
jgi:2'-5' RNA ligase